MKDIELLQSVHETAEMGLQGIHSLEGQVGNDELRRELARQAAEYRQIAAAAERMLRERGLDPKDPGLMARLSAEVMSTVKTLADPSASNIAEMMIQGNTMGITKGSRRLNGFDGDHQIRRLAEKLLATEEANVEKMKQYL